MKQIVLIHFLPLEYYPPVTNMVDYLAEELNSEINLSVFSTKNTKKRDIYKNEKVNIFRTSQSEYNEHKLIRLWKYIYFQISVLFKLIILRPKKILYYETLSSFPVFLYKRYIKRSTKVYIHYHEYTTSNEYEKKSMATKRFFHKLEQKYLYKKATWISHTNKDRLIFFHKDNPQVDKAILKEMPNYPPKLWEKKIIQKPKNVNIPPLKCVYIGALSFEDTFIKEFTEWVISQKGNVYFDIYTYNIQQKTEKYLNTIHSPYINFYNSGVEYNNLPLLFSKYHVGVILYKGRTMNYEFNAPNKFFEYLVCGLEIWFPDVMKGILPYVQKVGDKKIVPIDFKSIKKHNWKNSITNNNLFKSYSLYFCNNVYKHIKNELNS